MSVGSGATRWWEGYLVRYFMPSIAGVAIVLWLSSIAGDEFKNLLLIPKSFTELTSPRLILLILYANLFCYIASYPILGFHATRVLDFKNIDHWPSFWWIDGYIWSLVLGVISFVIARFSGNKISFFMAYITVLIFVVVQFIRIFLGLNKREKFKGLEESASSFYGYAHALAKRRSLIEEIESVTSPEVASEEDNPQSATTTKRQWRPEFMDTYRHMREHGNSAFIFYLELSLAALVYAVVSVPSHSPTYQLSAIGVLFGIWALPAVFIHLIGQHLERRFSQYNRRS